MPPSDASAEVDELVRRAREGSAASFSELVLRYQAPLYQFLVVYTGNPTEAEEICQDAFVRSWDKLHTFRPGAPFGPWLFGLSRRVAASHFRRLGRHDTQPLGEEPSSDERGPVERSSSQERAERLWDLAARVLDEQQRSALWLHYAEGMNAAEVGAVLGRRTGSVRVLLHRARKRLAEHIEAPGEESAGESFVAPLRTLPFKEVFE